MELNLVLRSVLWLVHNLEFVKDFLLGERLEIHLEFVMVHCLVFEKDFLLGPHLEFVMDLLLEERSVFAMEIW